MSARRSNVLPLVFLFVIVAFSVRADARVIVVPHFLERVGLVNSTAATFDTQFFVTYTGGLSDGDLAPGVMVNLYIFDDLTGQPLLSATNAAVCDPCSFNVSAANRKAIGTVEGLANSVGGLPRPEVTGYMAFEIKNDPLAADVSSFVINSHFLPPFPTPPPLPTPPPPPDLSSRVNLSCPPPPLRGHRGPIGSGQHEGETFGGCPPATFVEDSWMATLPEFQEDAAANNESFNIAQDISVVYTAGLAGSETGTGATARLRIYDGLFGHPLLSATNQPVCDPCSVDLTMTDRKRTFSFDELIRAAGGFPRPNVTGFATVEVSGDTRKVVMDPRSLRTLDSANRVEFVNQAMIFRMQAPPPIQLGYVLPTIIETPGTVNTTQFTYDTLISMSYTGGLPGIPGGGGAEVDLHLLDDATGLPMTHNGQNVCSPCTYQLAPTNRKISIRVNDLITARGAFDAGTKLGFGLLVVRGQDPDAVNVLGFVVNAHTSPFDLSVFGFAPQPTPAEAQFGPGTDGRADPRLILSAEYKLPHFRDRVGKASNTQYTLDSEIHAVYNGESSAMLELYLYDQATSLPLLSSTGQSVCNPCTLPLNTVTKKRRIIFDDLITAAGGFPRPDVSGFARMRITGDVPNVALLNMLINAHTGPNDVSISQLPHRRLLRRVTDFDMNGDGRADKPIFRVGDPLGVLFYILHTGSNFFRSFQWGSPGDKVVPGDIDGDAKTDFIVYRPPNNTFYGVQSSDSTFRMETIRTGQLSDAPGARDWDGDGKDELLIFTSVNVIIGRSEPRIDPGEAAPNAQMYFHFRPTRNNPNGAVTTIPWGTTGDEPLRGDFDGDGKADAAVFRPSNAVWYILNSSDGSVRFDSWGLASDRRVAGDYDGDGIDDLAVYRDGIWHIKGSLTGYRALQWGLSTDVLVPADYDGDGRTDIAVWRPSNGIWYVLESSHGGGSFVQFGQAGDRPLQCVADTTSTASCP